MEVESEKRTQNGREIESKEDRERGEGGGGERRREGETGTEKVQPTERYSDTLTVVLHGV